VFTAVARNLSFAQAAKELNVSAPAVTMQIRELEQEVGMPLFDRRGRVVSLTTAGEYLVVYARKMLAILKDAEDASARLQRAEIGLLTIGIVRTAKYYMMEMLGQFQQRYPDIEIKLAIGNRDQLSRMLENNEVDLAIMGSPPKTIDARAEPFAAHPLVFIAKPNHPLTELEKISTDDLRGQEFIVRELGSGTRFTLEKYFAELKLEPKLKMVLDSNESIKLAVMAGLGVGFLSLHTIGFELEHERLAILDINQTPIFRSWNVVHNRAKVLTPLAEAFRYFMLENAESYLATHFYKYLEIDQLKPESTKRSLKKSTARVARTVRTSLN
jgi:DNA-binding transcriptional LysR family regulator